jgi:hypothetical protein
MVPVNLWRTPDLEREYGTSDEKFAEPPAEERAATANFGFACGGFAATFVEDEPVAHVQRRGQ